MPILFPPGNTAFTWRLGQSSFLLSFFDKEFSEPLCVRPQLRIYRSDSKDTASHKFQRIPMGIPRILTNTPTLYCCCFYFFPRGCDNWPGSQLRRAESCHCQRWGCPPGEYWLLAKDAVVQSTESNTPPKDSSRAAFLLLVFTSKWRETSSFLFCVTPCHLLTKQMLLVSLCLRVSLYHPLNRLFLVTCRLGLHGWDT